MLDGELRRRLAPARAKPYVVFHDAYQYFEARYGLSPVGSVTVSPDLGHARVRVSVLGEEAERKASVEALTHARGFIRRQLGRRLKLRVTPELLFELDRGPEHSQRISDLLEELRHEHEGP